MEDKGGRFKSSTSRCTAAQRWRFRWKLQGSSTGEQRGGSRAAQAWGRRAVQAVAVRIAGGERWQISMDIAGEQRGGEGQRKRGGRLNRGRRHVGEVRRRQARPARSGRGTGETGEEAGVFCLSGICEGAFQKNGHATSFPGQRE